MGSLTDFAWVMAALAMGLLMYAALHDLAARTVPNWVSVVILGLGAAIRLGDHSLIAGLAIVAITFVVLAVIWRFGAVGGGDVKLWSASALLISPHWQPEMSFITQVALTGGVLALLYLGLRFVVPLPRASQAGSLVTRVLRVEAWRICRRGPLPYAIAIASGVILTLCPIPSLV